LCLRVQISSPTKTKGRTNENSYLRTQEYGIQAFDPSDQQIENRHAAVEFVQCDLRLFAGLYVVWRYPDVLASRGIDPRRLFACQEFTDVRHLIEEVTKKK
jgi:hypothetical protein